tara:strand:- start:251 stop:1009 length:759 start_codon:yes stop_codon:yes gene_type:complete
MMKIVNLTNQYLPGSTEGYDGKMRDHWPAEPINPQYDILDPVHIEWLYRIMLNTGMRVLVPDFEGNSRSDRPDLNAWERWDRTSSEQSLPLYSAASSYIDMAISRYNAERNLSSNFFLWGFYGFPFSGRRVALGTQTRNDYQAQNAQEEVVTDNFTALFPTLYLKDRAELRNGVFENTCINTRYALNMIRQERPVMPCIKEGLMSEKDFQYYLDMMQSIIEPTGFCYWDSYSAWRSGWGMDKLQVLESLKRQ